MHTSSPTEMAKERDAARLSECVIKTFQRNCCSPRNLVDDSNGPTHVLPALVSEAVGHDAANVSCCTHLTSGRSCLFRKYACGVLPNMVRNISIKALTLS